MKRTALLMLACLACIAALGCDLAPKPKPAPMLTVTPEAITLIQETEERCAKIAKIGVERVRSATTEQRDAREAALESARNGIDSAPLRKMRDTEDELAWEALDKYLKDEAAPHLAAVDRAGELIHELMPKVREEAPPDLTQAVQALLTGEEEVCHRARTSRPVSYNDQSIRPSQYSYQDNFDYAAHNYNNAEAKLQTLYTVSATDAQYALNKYTPMLDEASAGADRTAGSPMRPLSADELRRQRKEWEATQAYQQEQQAQHDAAVSRWREREEKKEPILAKIGTAPELAAKQSLSPEKRAQSMQAWYASYSGKVGPVRTALASYMSLRRGSPEKLTPVCQELLTATSALVSDPAALDLPDEAAAKALKKAYTDLRECARACVSGLDAEAAFRLAAYEGAFSQAWTALQPYNMTP